MAAGLLPVGVTIGSGKISRTPMNAGTFLFTVGITDSSIPPIVTYDQISLIIDPAGNRASHYTCRAARARFTRIDIRTEHAYCIGGNGRTVYVVDDESSTGMTLSAAGGLLVNAGVNSAANPAPKESVVILYVTGLGTTTSAVDNQLIPILPAVAPVTPTVTIGGVDAPVLAVQAPAGSISGLMQINVTVPSTIKAGPALPVIVTAGAATSQVGLTMDVK